VEASSSSTSDEQATTGDAEDSGMFENLFVINLSRRIKFIESFHWFPYCFDDCVIQFLKKETILKLSSVKK
jgi:hypothetical protein